ncbi:MAG: TrmH family RNA methyltransferase, partial [Acidimicrobiia bacterium]
MPELIDDPADPRLGDYVALSDPDHRRAGEIYIVEGEIALRRVVASGARFRSVLVSEKKVARLSDLRLDAPTLVVGQRALDALVGYHLHRGVVAAAFRPPPLDPVSLLGTPRIAVLEDLTDHENLGVIFRSAAALGVGAILLSPRCCDPYYRRAVRVSQGNVAAVPFATLEPWPSGLAMLRENGYSLVALT